MGLGKLAIVLFAVMFAALALNTIFSLALKDKSPDDLYNWTNQSINKTTGMVQPVLKESGVFAQPAIWIATTFLLAGALFYLGRRSHR